MKQSSKDSSYGKTLIAAIAALTFWDLKLESLERVDFVAETTCAWMKQTTCVFKAIACACAKHRDEAQKATRFARVN